MQGLGGVEYAGVAVINGYAYISSGSSVIYSAVGSINVTAAASCLGRVMGDNWTADTIGSESWTANSIGSETWTAVATDTNTWTPASVSSTSWTNNTIGSETWH